MVNSKHKGNRAEREVASLLTSLTGVRWNRVPCSGAIFTAGGDSDLKGDVYCKDILYADIVIEVKNYREPVTINEIVTQDSRFNRWLAQLSSERETNPGILFFKSKGKLFWYRQSSTISVIMGYDKLMMVLRNISLTYYSFGMIDNEKLSLYLAKVSNG